MRLLAAVFAVAAALATAAAPAAAARWFTELRVPSIEGQPAGPADGSSGKDLTIGPDGAIWWITQPTGFVARMPPGGGGRVFSKVDEFDAIEASSGIAGGPDGNVWFSLNTRVTTHESGGVARITPGGAVTVFRIPTAQDSSEVPVNAIAFASDGRLYAATGNGIGVFTPQTGWTFLPERPQCGGSPNDFAAGADGIMWYVVNGTCSELGRITPDGDVQPVNTRLASFPIQVAVARDGVVWATERAGAIAHFDPRSSAFGEVKLPTSAKPEPWGIAASPGRGAEVWVTDLGGAVWRVGANGGLRRLGRAEALRSDARPRTIAPGPLGALWFGISDPSPPAIGRLIPPRCKVPRLRGATLARAKRRVSAAGCRLGRVRGHGRRVRSQTPAAGAVRPERATVSVRLG